MKNNRKKPGELRTVRNRLNVSEVYYTYTHWELKEIDGIQFIPVVKFLDPKRTQTLHYVKKDNMEYVEC